MFLILFSCIETETILFTPLSCVKNKIKEKYFKIYVDLLNTSLHNMSGLFLWFHIFSIEQ